MVAIQGPFTQSRGDVRLVEELLNDWFHRSIHVERHRLADGAIELRAHIQATAVVMMLTTADAAAIGRGLEWAKRAGNKRQVPLVVVPYMSAAGRKRCAQAEVGWFDLSGNADIRAPKLRILVEGKPNRYTPRGRPATPFAPKSSRLARWLLEHPAASSTQRELALQTQLDPSQVSRLIARLATSRLVKVDAEGRVALGDRALMLEAWAEVYRFARHQVLRAHMPARSGPEGAGQLGRLLDRLHVQHAFTGLAGAWCYSHVASHRLVTAYVSALPSPDELREIDLVEQDQGSNVWLVVPNDRGVFDGARHVDRLACAHPVQVWLDLKGQAERSEEAATELYDRIVKGELDG